MVPRSLLPSVSRFLHTMQNMKCGHTYAVTLVGQRVYTHLGWYPSMINLFPTKQHGYYLRCECSWVQPLDGCYKKGPWDPSSGTTSHVSSWLLCAWCVIHLTRISRPCVLFAYCMQSMKVVNMCTYLIRALNICNEVPPLNKRSSDKQPFFYKS